MEKHLAHSCMVCDTTLEGPLGMVMGVFGIHRSVQNPNLCNRCETHFDQGKVVELTVLFADMVGFTSMTNELGPEKTYDIVEAFFQKANQALFNHDAFIDKYIGDAVMAIFNAPIQRANHAENAVAAALAIYESLPELKEQFNRDIQIRVGISSGYARVGQIGSKDRKDYTAVGDTVNLASRLEAQAQPGEILINEFGYKMISEKFPDVQPEALAIKGFTDEVRAFRVKANSDARKAFSPADDASPIATNSATIGSTLFAILGAPCAATAILGPLSVFLGAGALMGSLAPFLHSLDAPFVRIPFQVIALIGALANLYVIWHGYRKRSRDEVKFALTLSEKQKTRLVAVMSVVTLLAIAYENYAHVYLNHMTVF